MSFPQTVQTKWTPVQAKKSQNHGVSAQPAKRFTEVIYFFDPAKALTPKETDFVLLAVKDWARWLANFGDRFELETLLHLVKKQEKTTRRGGKNM